LAANAPVVKANASIANMILKNSEDFIYRSFILSRNASGTG
jgi:hypothetical protein